ncbi:hypothetical protein SCP_1302900 [Sparassis crispa]|uniref:Uncharacterized protein n=1 Tax=Sparassis crispa TaxID=139825 RepID=A0A401H231_9APHY|nr:hypothetical protein SCP_1302900 [Sparassis crispa]GBE88474.1 hypothetical protein SCP_1302900 [Sparassis crispa]
MRAAAQTCLDQVVEVLSVEALDDHDVATIQIDDGDPEWEDDLINVIELEDWGDMRQKARNKKKSLSAGLWCWLAYREMYLEELI